MTAKSYRAGMMQLTLDTSGFDREQKEMLAKVKNAKPPLTRFMVEFAQSVGREWNSMTFGSLYSASRNFRDAAIWRPVKPQYVREDGTRVPPWGGIARSQHGLKGQKVLRKTGTVQGKKRPSGARVKPSEIVGKDTKKMAREFTGPPKFTEDGRTAILSTNRPYAARQNKLRPFNQFSMKDAQRLRYWVTNWLDALIVARNRRNVR